MAKRVKMGDVVQILTSRGIAYAQMTHKHQGYGPLLAVFEGIHDQPPADFADLVAADPQFRAFFPLQPAVNQGLLSIVANLPVAASNSVFPLFRSCVCDREGKRGPWWIWDGQTETMLTRALTDEEKRFSLRGIISAPLLVERIENNYRPQTHDV